MKAIIFKNKMAIALFLIAILSGLFWSHKMFGRPISNDEIQYNFLAKNILLDFKYVSNEENLLTPAATEPFYPIFLAGVYLLFGAENFDAVRIIQILLFAFTVLIIYFLAKNVIEEKTAVLASLLTALFFPLAASAGFLYRESLSAFLLVLLVYLLYKIQKTLGLKWFILSGIVLGLAVLTNAIIQFFVFFILLGFIFIFRKDFFRKQFLVKIGFFVLLSLLPMTIWNLRSSDKDAVSTNIKTGYTLARRAEMIEDIRGEKYLRHLGGQLSGYYFVEKEGFDETEFLGSPKLTKKIKEMSDEGYSAVEIGDILKQESINTIFRNIPQYFAVSFLDFLQFNGPMLPNSENLSAAPMQNLFTKGTHQELSRPLKIAILLILRMIYWLFSGFVIYGLITAFRDWQKFIWIILVVIYFNAVYSALFGLPRYAIPIHPFYIILFIYGASLFLLNLNLYCEHKKRQNK